MCELAHSTKTVVAKRARNADAAARVGARSCDWKQIFWAEVLMAP
jgi:hypothetical protein